MADPAVTALSSAWYDTHEAIRTEHLIEPFGWVTHLRVCRLDGADGVSWDTLQAIKSDLGFADAWAVEVYPPDDAVVNLTNMRHLWIMPSDYAWPIDLRQFIPGWWRRG